MAEFTPCKHDGESMISLMEQHGYSEDDMLLCKFCQKEEIEGLTDALEQYRSDLAERDKVARDRLKRIEQFEAALAECYLMTEISDQTRDLIYECRFAIQQRESVMDSEL